MPILLTAPSSAQLGMAAADGSLSKYAYAHSAPCAVRGAEWHGRRGWRLEQFMEQQP